MGIIVYFWQVLVGESIVKQTDPGKGIGGLFGKDISMAWNLSFKHDQKWIKPSFLYFKVLFFYYFLLVFLKIILDHFLINPKELVI